MVNLILQFVACARAAELRVSTAEVMDCLAQIRLVDMLDEKQVYAVLRANFAKSRREQRRFEHLSHLFFHELQVHPDTAGASSLAVHSDAIRDSLKTVAPYLQMLQEIQAEGDSRRKGPGSKLGALVRRFPVLRALDRAGELVDRFLADHRDEIYWETRRQIQQHLNRRIAARPVAMPILKV
jgi:uncharacterized protein